MSCTCCREGGPTVGLLILLELVRTHFGRPVTISSLSRCEHHNRKERGSKNSRHLINKETNMSDAADITVAGVEPQLVYEFLLSLPYANLLGLGNYKTFTHMDLRGWPARF